MVTVTTLKEPIIYQKNKAKGFTAGKIHSIMEDLRKMRCKVTPKLNSQICKFMKGE